MEYSLHRANFSHAEGVTVHQVHNFLAANIQHCAAYDKQYSRPFADGVRTIGMDKVTTPDGIVELMRYIIADDQESRVAGGDVGNITFGADGFHVDIQTTPRGDIVIVPELWGFSQIVSDGRDGRFVPVHFHLDNPNGSMLFRSSREYLPDLPITSNAKRVIVENARPLIPSVPPNSTYVLRNSYGHLGDVGKNTEIHGHNAHGGIRIGSIGKGSRLYAEGGSSFFVNHALEGVNDIEGHDQSQFKIERLGSEDFERGTTLRGDFSLDVSTVMGNWYLFLDQGSYSISADEVSGSVFLPEAGLDYKQLRGSSLHGCVTDGRSSFCCVDRSVDGIQARRHISASYKGNYEIRHSICYMHPEYLAGGPAEVTAEDSAGISVGVYNTGQSNDSHVVLFHHGTPIIIADSLREIQTRYLQKMPYLLDR